MMTVRRGRRLVKEYLYLVRISVQSLAQAKYLMTAFNNITISL